MQRLTQLCRDQEREHAKASRQRSWLPGCRTGSKPGVENQKKAQNPQWQQASVTAVEVPKGVGAVDPDAAIATGAAVAGCSSGVAWAMLWLHDRLERCWTTSLPGNVQRAPANIVKATNAGASSGTLWRLRCREVALGLAFAYQRETPLPADFLYSGRWRR